MSEIITVPENEITDLYSEAIQTHQQIMVNGTIATQAIVKLCENLKRMRDEKLYEQLGYAVFENYCEDMVGIKSRMAYNYISVYENLGPSVLQSNANLGITKLELITKMNPVERADMLENGELQNMSVSEIKELIKKNKEQGEQITLLTLQLENEKNEASAENPETDKFKERIKELEEQIVENNEYDAEEDELYEKVKQLEEELRKKESAHKIELEQLSETISSELREQIEEEIKAEMSADRGEQDNSAAVQEQIDKAVADAKKETEKEVKAALKVKSDKQAEKIKALEEAIASAGTEKEKLQKQLALSDSKSAKAMVYIDALQNNFNSLFAIISEMDAEQQNKFKGAVLKLTSAMQKKAEE